MLATWLTDRLGLTVPVVCAPMAGVAGGALAAAVSDAGGLGLVGIGREPVEGVQAQFALVANGDRKFGAGLLAWVLADRPELLDITLEAKPSLVSISFGDWQQHVQRVKESGALFATQVGTVAEARYAASSGVDVLVARGGEGGGHGRDLVATLPLLQGVLDAVDVPVLAAGGIGTARGLAAVLAAGAAGAWVGTAFLTCVESLLPPQGREVAFAAEDRDTIYTTVLDAARGAAWPTEFGGRAVRSEFTDTWHGRDDEVRATGAKPETWITWAGQGVGLLHESRPAADVVAGFAAAEQLLRDAASRSR
ncbi:MAG: nitronate monooxygenase [Frankiales bacterium]|nr:nitronate monooxygenase [Frankiales bacterium]